LRSPLAGLCIVLVGLAAAPLSAAPHALPHPPMDPAAGVQLGLSTCFWEAAPDGFFPLRVEMRNDADRRRDWTLQMRAEGDLGSGETFESGQTLSLGPRETRVLDLAVPLRPTHTATSVYSQLQLSIEGPGAPVHDVTLFMSRHYLPYSSGPHMYSPWIGMSESVASSYWEPTKSTLTSRSATELLGSRFDPACLPSDGRTYKGFAALALGADEWHDAAPETRRAIEQWVIGGGQLWVVGGAPDAGSLGFGAIRSVPADAPPASALADLAAEPALARGDDYTSWPLLAQLPAPALRKGILFSFLCGFAFVVGPINLFGLCRGKRRHRVVWTTPVLSTAASLLMGIGILLQDGTGAVGQRLVVVGLLPARHEEIVLQEQLARSGLLLNGAFAIAEPLAMEPLQITPENRQRRVSRLVRDGDVFSGDWFTSRSLQGHYLETIRPSRARFEMLAEEGGTPQLLSTVPDTLDDVYLRDAADHLWHAASVSPGRKAALERVHEQDFATWLRDVQAPTGPRLRRGSRHFPFIVAYARHSTAAIPTLAGVRWEDRGTLYMQRTD
jgi:hypothetical protein